MYKDQGGKCVELQGIKCHLPPQPPLHEVSGYNLPKKDQKWIPTPLPTFRAKDIEIFSGTKYSPYDIITWEEACREEEIKNTGYDPYDLTANKNPKAIKGIVADLSYRMPALSRFRKQEIDRVINGFWFMNNGVPTYLTGIGYMYFNWWNLDVGLPNYYRYIRELLYVVEWIREHPVILGLLLASMRGVGKSYLAACILYTIISFSRNALGGMQSKTDTDCDKLFELRLCEPINKLPNFLVPIHSWPGECPKGQLDFYANKRQHPNFTYDRFIRESAIRSLIEHRNSKDDAYDSETVTILLQDEIGKITKRVGNLLVRFGKIKDCVFRGNTKRGIIFGFTTVGEMEKGGGLDFKKLYETSDVSTLNEIGDTKTSCVSYFIGALESTVFDKYGDPVIEPPKDKETIKYIREKYGAHYVRGSRFFHETKKKQLFDEGMSNGDLRAYTAYCQDHPFNISDAFSFSGKDCIFNADILKTVHYKLTSAPKETFVRMGNFEWVEKDKEVKFVENKLKPRCFVSMMPDGKVWMPNDFKCWMDHNKKQHFYPTNDKFASAGFDPFSHKDVVDKNKASKAAFTLRTKFNFHFGDDSNIPIVHYKFRTYDPKESFEDIIKICFFYGVQVLIENNKGGISAINYFEDRGYERFIMRRPAATFTRKDQAQDTPGMAMSAGIIEQYCNLAAEDITNNGHRFKHIEIVEDALEFDPNNTQKFDSFVSYGLSLIAAEKKVAENTSSFDLSGLIPTYNIAR